VLGWSGPVSSRRIHASNTERGGTFQLLCRDALNKALSRNFDLEVRIRVGNGRPHNLDLATRERDIVAECKAFAFIMMRRNATVYLRSMRDVQRALIVKSAHIPSGGDSGAVLRPLEPQFPRRDNSFGDARNGRRASLHQRLLQGIKTSGTATITRERVAGFS
jgi:hypothetical protein